MAVLDMLAMFVDALPLVDDELVAAEDAKGTGPKKQTLALTYLCPSLLASIDKLKVRGAGSQTVLGYQACHVLVRHGTFISERLGSTGRV